MCTVKKNWEYFMAHQYMIERFHGPYKTFYLCSTSYSTFIPFLFGFIYLFIPLFGKINKVCMAKRFLMMSKNHRILEKRQLQSKVNLFVITYLHSFFMVWLLSIFKENNFKLASFNNPLKMGLSTLHNW